MRKKTGPGTSDGWYLRRNQLEWRIRSSVKENIAGGPYETEQEARAAHPGVEDAVCSAEDGPLELWERRTGKWTKHQLS